MNMSACNGPHVGPGNSLLDGLADRSPIRANSCNSCLPCLPIPAERPWISALSAKFLLELWTAVRGCPPVTLTCPRHIIFVSHNVSSAPKDTLTTCRARLTHCNSTEQKHNNAFQPKSAKKRPRTHCFVPALEPFTSPWDIGPFLGHACLGIGHFIHSSAAICNPWPLVISRTSRSAIHRSL